MPEHRRPKVLLIGWDAADWQHITPLLDQGLLPTIEEFINAGVMGNLATLEPILSPMLWNSIATGKRPEKHGILGFTEPNPEGGGIRPAASTSRKVKAIWNILTQKGYKTHVVGWFAGHPAEPINGVCISPQFALATAPLGKPWPLPPGTVHPRELGDDLKRVRIHPGALGAGELLPFVPRGAEIDQEKDKHISSLAKILAENCTIHNAATWIMQNREWDFLGVYYNGIDHFCHGFMKFHPPRLPGVDEKQFEIYKDVVNGAYRFHDMMLHTLLQLAGPDTTVILCSDHGFHSDHLRPLAIPKTPAGPAVCHRPLGVVAMKGPGIKADERIYGANLLDVAPTILTVFGLPAGEDMDGRPLLEAFGQPPDLEKIPSWEEVPGECGMHPPGERTDPVEAQAALDQLVALGYIEPPDEDKSKAMAICVRETKFNLARAYMDAGNSRGAKPSLEELAGEDPKARRFHQQLAQCCLDLRDVASARRILERLLKGSEPGPWTEWMLGIIKFEEGQVNEALKHFERVEAANPRMPTLHIRLGNALLKMRRWDEAGRAFEKALGIDGDSPQAHLGAGIVALRLKDLERAAQETLAAVGIQHFLPLGHYYLGVALVRLGHLERARLAFETAISMAPGLIAAHRFLSALHRQRGDLDKAAAYRLRVAELRRKREQPAN